MPLRITRATASAAVALTALLTSAIPAWAAPGDANAYGVNAKVMLVGKQAVEKGPFAAAAVKGPTDNTFAGVDLPGLVKAGVINTSANHNDRSGAFTAKASTADIQLALLKTLAGGDIGAQLIEAQCEATDQAVAGATKVVGAKLGKLGTVATTPAPNTVIDVTPAGAPVAKLIFNEQIQNPDGTTTVNGLHVKLLSGAEAIGSGDLIISSATCAAAAKSEITPTKTASAPATSPSTSTAVAAPTTSNTAGPELAATGANSAWLIGGSLAALALGFGALQFVRSRKAISG